MDVDVMDTNNLTLEAIQTYYKVLKKTGYCDYNQVYNLLILVFINKLLGEEFDGYRTEEDVTLLFETVKCLSKNTCIIPSIISRTHSEPLSTFIDKTKLRATEDLISRQSEYNVLRIENSTYA